MPQSGPANGHPPLTTLQRYKDLIDRRLQSEAAAFQCETILRDACSYALEGGKRLRGSILLSFFEALGGRAPDALGFAAAIEMIQAYSLVHDDLPCMDDDDFRRGKPSCHKQFGYATALLAGDALLTAAFEDAASCALPSSPLSAGAAPLPAERVARGIAALSRAAGPSGMVGGQVLDLEMEREVAGEAEDNARAIIGGPAGASDGPLRVKRMYAMKTGALFQVSARLGAILAGAPPALEDAAAEWGALFGFAYQVLDDIDDQGQSQKEQEKATLEVATSRDEARAEARGALERGLAVLASFGGRNRLALELTQRYLVRAG